MTSATASRGTTSTPRFPTDSELVEHYGVSRQTVREAVRRLSGEGLLDRERGRGTFVRTSALHHPVGTLPEIFGSIREHLGPVVSTVRRVQRAADPDVAERLGLDHRRRRSSSSSASATSPTGRSPTTRRGYPPPSAKRCSTSTSRPPCSPMRSATAADAPPTRSTSRSAPPSPHGNCGRSSTCPPRWRSSPSPPAAAQRGLPFECRRVSFRADRLHLTSRWTSNERTRPTIGAATTSPKLAAPSRNLLRDQVMQQCSARSRPQVRSPITRIGSG